MGWRVEITAKAIEDLENIVSFLAKESPTAAARLGESLVSQVFMLTRFPERGAPVKKRPGVRMRVHGHFCIIYQLNHQHGAVEILRIWDSRQNPSRFWLR